MQRALLHVSLCYKVRCNEEHTVWSVTNKPLPPSHYSLRELDLDFDLAYVVSRCLWIDLALQWLQDQSFFTMGIGDLEVKNKSRVME